MMQQHSQPLLEQALQAWYEDELRAPLAADGSAGELASPSKRQRTAGVHALSTRTLSTSATYIQ